MTEKEKTDYTSGKFLTCIADFDIFKAGEKYWLEYVGDNTYCGRSDNILGKMIQISPFQLENYLLGDGTKKQLTLRELINRLEKLSMGGRNDNLPVFVDIGEGDYQEVSITGAYIDRYESPNDEYDYISLQSEYSD